MVPDGCKERVERLLRDVASTLGERVARDALHLIDNAMRADWGGATDDTRIRQAVDDVQQFVHDTREDTSWPVCARHGRHPLWFHEGWWWCEADRVAVVALGELGARATPDAATP